MSLGQLLLECFGGRAIAVPGGVFVHHLPMASEVDQFGLASALSGPQLNGFARIYVAAGAEHAAKAYADLHSPVDRQAFVAVSLEQLDLRAAERLAENVMLPVLVPAGIGRSQRLVTVDEHWALVLPLALAATRAVHQAFAREVMANPAGATPSWHRVRQLLAGAGRFRDEFHFGWTGVGNGGGARLWPEMMWYAAGVYLARYGSPAGVPIESILRSLAAPTWAQVQQLVGVEATRANPTRLLSALAATQGSAALVRTGTDEVFWLMNDGARTASVRWVRPWLDGGADTLNLAEPSRLQKMLAVLSDPATRTVLVDGDGRPTTVDALSDPMRRMVPAGPHAAPRRSAMGRAGIRPPAVSVGAGLPAGASNVAAVGERARKVTFKEPSPSIVAPRSSIDSTTTSPDSLSTTSSGATLTPADPAVLADTLPEAVRLANEALKDSGTRIKLNGAGESLAFRYGTTRLVLPVEPALQRAPRPTSLWLEAVAPTADVQSRGLVVRIRPGASPRRMADELIRLAPQALAKAATPTIGRRVVHRTVLDRFDATMKSRPSRLSALLSDAERARLAALGRALAVLERVPQWSHGLAQDGRSNLVKDQLAAEARVVEELRQMGALRDQPNGPNRAEAILSWLSATNRFQSKTVELVRKRLWDRRSDLSQAKVLAGLDAAAKSFAVQTQERDPRKSSSAVAVAVKADGRDGPVLRVIAPSGERVRPTDADYQELSIHLLDDSAWQLAGYGDRSVALEDEDLFVRADASDASFMVDLAGVLTRFALARAKPDAQPADLDAAGLVMERETVNRLHFQGHRFGWRRFKRWLSRHTFGLAGDSRVLREARQRVDKRIEALRGTGEVSAEVDELLVEVVARQAVLPIEPMSDKAPLYDHLVRRELSFAGSAVLGIAAGYTVHRAEVLTWNGVTNSFAFNAVQGGYSDPGAANLALAGPPKSVLVAAERPKPVQRYQQKPWGTPKAQTVKRAPASLSSATLGAVISGGMTHAPLIALMSWALYTGQSVVQIAADYFADRPRDGAKALFDHYYKVSPDHHRNLLVETMAAVAFELRGRLRDSGQLLTETQRQQLRVARNNLLKMQPGLVQEAKSKVRDLYRRRTLARELRELFGIAGPLDRGDDKVTYDPLERGIPGGVTSVLANALRTGTQHTAFQVPGLGLSFWLHANEGFAIAMALMGALRGLAYGRGWSLGLITEYLDSTAKAADVAAKRVDQLINVMGELIGDPDIAWEPVPDPPIPDPAQYPKTRWFSEYAAMARHQKQLNKEAGHPMEVTWRQQIFKKGIPNVAGTMAGVGIAAAAGYISGPVVPIMFGVGLAQQAAVTAGEGALRVHEPENREMSRNDTVRREVARLPWRTDEFTDKLAQVSEVAAELEVIPVPVRHVPLITRFANALNKNTIGRGIRTVRFGRRVYTRVENMFRIGGPHRMLTRTPAGAGPVRLTRADRVAVRELNNILANLADSTNERFTARPDLNENRVLAELAEHLDTLGLRAEQPGSQARWHAVTKMLSSHYGRDLTGHTSLGVLRGILIDVDGGQPPAGQLGADELAAIQAARAKSPVVEQLWAAVHRLTGERNLNRYRFDIISATEVEVTTAGGRTFGLTLDPGAEPPQHPATIRLAPDDLLRAAFDSQLAKPHRLMLPAAALADPDRLAATLYAAAEAVRQFRYSSFSARAGRIWNHIGSLVIPLDPKLAGTTVEAAPPPLAAPATQPAAVGAGLLASAAPVAMLGVDPRGTWLPEPMVKFLRAGTWAGAADAFEYNKPMLANQKTVDLLSRFTGRSTSDRRLAVLRTAVELELRTGLSADRSRIAPVATELWEPEPTPTGSVDGTFVFDYLADKASRTERLLWDGLLLSAAAAERLSFTQATRLVRALGGADAWANAQVFEAVGMLMERGPAEFDAAAKLVTWENCKLNPDDKWAWWLRLDRLRADLRRAGRFEVERALDALTGVLADCT